MGSEQEQIRSIAERIARRLADAREEGGEEERGTATASAAATNAAAADLAALRAGLSEIQRRLAHLESHLAQETGRATRGDEADSTRRRQPNSPAHSPAHDAPGDAPSSATVTRSPWLSGTYVPATAAHPSEERFGIHEAVSEIVDYFEREKTCNMEPGEKPCDHCAMCSSRGF